MRIISKSLIANYNKVNKGSPLARLLPIKTIVIHCAIPTRIITKTYPLANKGSINYHIKNIKKRLRLLPLKLISLTN